MNKNNLLNILMCFAMLTWGMAWTSAKIVNEYLNYNNLVFLRFFVGVLTMIPFVFLRGSLFLKFQIILDLIFLLLEFYFIFIINVFIATDKGIAGMELFL